ncbi:MAG: hypothetical protein DMF61_07405 [Blastocatellia bacterium AA13]|nr:MAG: hypothetical protein DMF61_07405 [Blastocatellia bacterium AA13]
MSSAIADGPVNSQPLSRYSSLSVPVAAALIAIFTLIFYSNSFTGPFVFDDHVYIDENPYIHQLWPPGAVLVGLNNISRPLIAYSLALNYKISGSSPWSYHAFNILIHVIAAIALFGVVRRTLLSERLSKRYQDIATPVAMVIGLIWAVHPIQTQAVTYVIQRCESLMGMFYLLAVYCSLRSFEAARRNLWIFGAAAACICGMLSKQVMVTAPLMILVFDYLFFSNSVREALRSHWRLYAGLALGWAALLITVLISPVNDTAGFAVKSISPFRYFISEFAVVWHYIRLSLVPAPLAFDYAWPRAESIWAAIAYGIPLFVPAALTAFGLWRRAPWAIFGAWFFIILSVSSSIMPFNDLAYEYRVYLSLAGVISGMVFGAIELWRGWLHSRVATACSAINGGRLAFLLVIVMVASLGILTLSRNQDYKTEMGLWADTIVKLPANPRARINFGTELQTQGRLADAVAQFTESIAIDPSNAGAFYNRGSALKTLGQFDQAAADFNEALRLEPRYAKAHNNLGSLLVERRDLKSAEVHFRKALEISPDSKLARLNLAGTLAAQRQFGEAQEHAEKLLEFAPKLAEAHFIVALCRESAGDLVETDKHLRLAIEYDPSHSRARTELAKITDQQQQPPTNK